MATAPYKRRGGALPPVGVVMDDDPAEFSMPIVGDMVNPEYESLRQGVGGKGGAGLTGSTKMALLTCSAVLTSSLLLVLVASLAAFAILNAGTLSHFASTSDELGTMVAEMDSVMVNSLHLSSNETQTRVRDAFFKFLDMIERAHRFSQKAEDPAQNLLGHVQDIREALEKLDYVKLIDDVDSLSQKVRQIVEHVEKLGITISVNTG